MKVIIFHKMKSTSSSRPGSPPRRCAQKCSAECGAFVCVCVCPCVCVCLCVCLCACVFVFVCTFTHSVVLLPSRRMFSDQFGCQTLCAWLYSHNMVACQSWNVRGWTAIFMWTARRLASQPLWFCYLVEAQQHNPPCGSTTAQFNRPS